MSGFPQFDIDRSCWQCSGCPEPWLEATAPRRWQAAWYEGSWSFPAPLWEQEAAALPRCEAAWHEQSWPFPPPPWEREQVSDSREEHARVLLLAPPHEEALPFPALLLNPRQSEESLQNSASLWDTFCQTSEEQEEGSEAALPSMGSRSHARCTCEPCLFITSPPIGCKDGIECGFCHKSHRTSRLARPGKSKRVRFRKLVERELGNAELEQLVERTIANDERECMTQPKEPQEAETGRCSEEIAQVPEKRDASCPFSEQQQLHQQKEQVSAASSSDDCGSGAALASQASEKHEQGTCKPCLFINTPIGCMRAAACIFCHVHHGARVIARPSKRKRLRYRRLFEKESTNSSMLQLGHDVEAEDPGNMQVCIDPAVGNLGGGLAPESTATAELPGRRTRQADDAAFHIPWMLPSWD